MSQTLHIFRKDTRYLRLEIGLVFLLSAAFAFSELALRQQLWVRALLTFAAVYLIARLIHAETIPGENQFWISRPYQWKSLLAAKLLFILVFIQLPIFAARLTVLTLHGFPLSSTLPGLLWSQCLMIFVVSLPIAAVAAITSGLVPFIFAALIMVAVGIAVLEIMVPPSLPSVRTVIDQVQWIWDAVAALALALAAIPILCFQYRNRLTFINRTLAVSVAALIAVAYLYVPWPFALFVQTHLSKPPAGSPSMYVALDPTSKHPRAHYGRHRTSTTSLEFPLAVKQIPANMDVDADALALSLRDSHGRIVWHSGPYELPVTMKNPADPGVTLFNTFLDLPADLYTRERGQTLSLHGYLYLTSFGNAQSKTIPIQNRPVDAIDGLQCFAGPMQSLICRSPLRWPQRLISANFQETGASSFTYPISYSPFPAELGFDDVKSDDVSMPAMAHQVTIIAKEPLAHFRLDFDIPNIKLPDFVEPKWH